MAGFEVSTEARFRDVCFRWPFMPCPPYPSSIPMRHPLILRQGSRRIHDDGGYARTPRFVSESDGGAALEPVVIER